jgi:hypothetical protein
MTTSNVLNSDLEVKSTSAQTKHDSDENVVRPCTENTHCTVVEHLAAAKARAVYPISTGQTRNFNLNAGSGVNCIEVSLNWGVPANSLSLTIYNPARKNLGTYFDNADGIIDGKIHLSIYPDPGVKNIATGRWVFTVKGESVSGTQNFTIDFYTH